VARESLFMVDSVGVRRHLTIVHHSSEEDMYERGLVAYQNDMLWMKNGNGYGRENTNMLWAKSRELGA